MQNNIRVATSIVSVLFLLCSCSDDSSPTPPPAMREAEITFIELGSVNCIPCQNMQPIMQSLRERYGSEQLSVVFIDVLKEPNEAAPYHIIVMPTQVFLDKNGAEFHRHEGFYPEAEIDSLLQAHGLAPL